MKKLLIALTTVICLFSCEKKQGQEITHTGEFEIHFLFEHDGCKVYRFDDGHSVYWSDCSGDLSYEYQTHHRSGKTTYSETHYVQTMNN
jgi:hypothetical protein